MSNVTQRKKPTDVVSDASDASPKDAAPKAKKASLVYLVFQVLAWGAVLALVSSYLVTETWTWGYKGKYTNLKRYIPVSFSFPVSFPLANINLGLDGSSFGLVSTVS